jgi:hypothetical protein
MSVNTQMLESESMPETMGSPSQSKRSPAIALAAVGLLTATLAAVPYLLLRRDYQAMRTSMEQITGIACSLRHQLKDQNSLLVSVIKREEQLRLKTRLEQTMREAAKLRRQVDEIASHRTAQERAFQAQLEQIRKEHQHHRSV